MLKKLLFIPTVYTILIRNVSIQKRFIKKHIDPIICNYINEDDKSISDYDIFKIKTFYALGIPAIIGELICKLHDKKMTFSERAALTFVGAATGLFDDFFDKHNINQHTILSFIETPKSVVPSNSYQKLILKFYTEIFSYIENKDQFIALLKEACFIQQASNKQKTLLSFEEIKKITFYKGAAAILLCRSIYNIPIEEDEKKMLSVLGGIIQLGDDIFDVYEDCHNNIKTVITTTSQIDNVRKFFINQLIDFKNLCNKLKNNYKNVPLVYNVFLFAICRCFVALDQYEKLQQKTNNQFVPIQYLRSELICDMQKNKNFFRSIYYYINTL